MGTCSRCFGLTFRAASAGQGAQLLHGCELGGGGSHPLNLTYLEGQNITVDPPINSSLNDHLRWFEELKPSLCEIGSCFAQSPFVMGQIGGNDHMAAILISSKKTLEQARSFVPEIVNTISDGVEVRTNVYYCTMHETMNESTIACARSHTLPNVDLVSAGHVPTLSAAGRCPQTV